VFLAGHGWLDPAADPAERVTRERIGAYVGDLRLRLASLSVWTQVDKLMAVLVAGRPAGTWGWLRRVVRRLKAQAHPVRPIASRLLPTSEMFATACAAMDAIEADPPRERQFGDTSAHYRDALMVALLAARPLRRRSVALLEVGQHLVATGTGYRLILDELDTKTGAPIAFPLPDALAPYMRRYLDHHRPRMLNGVRTTALWVTRQRTPLAYNSIGKSVKTATRRLFGRELTPHLFRHAAATSTAIAAPKEARLIRALLGHKTLAMADRVYNKASSLDAGRRYHALLEDRFHARRRRRKMH
jgi:integrase